MTFSIFILLCLSILILSTGLMSNRPWAIKLMARVLRRKVVLLLDHHNKIYWTMERTNPFTGEREAPVFWFTNIGNVTLNDDQTTSGASIYIRSWKYH